MALEQNASIPRFDGMTHKSTTIERAFELARSGKVATVDTIRAILKREGYDGAQLSGPLLLRRLRLTMYDARRA
jgi:hypothetical protein